MYCLIALQCYLQYQTDQNSHISQYLMQSVLLLILWTGTIIDSFHWSGSSSLIKIELMTLWIPDHNISIPAWNSPARIWSLYGDLYFSTLQWNFQPQKDHDQILTVQLYNRLCGLVGRVPGYRSTGPGSIPGTTKFSEKWVWNGIHSTSWVQLRSYLERKRSGSSLENREYSYRDPSCLPRGTL
jgi:hypothetical protein